MVNSSGAEAKAEKIIEEIRLRIKERISEVGAKLQAEVLAHAPTHDQEYETLMIGDQPDSAVELIPLSGDHSSDPDDRVRFSKTPNSWISDTVMEPANLVVRFEDVGMIAVAIGNLALHEENSVFTYQNEKNPAPVTVGPYFMAFEAGSVTAGWRETVTPRGVGAKGVPYPLRPDADPTHKPFSMYKPIFPRGMYSVSVLESVARAALIEIMQEINPRKS